MVAVGLSPMAALLIADMVGRVLRRVTHQDGGWPIPNYKLARTIGQSLSRKAAGSRRGMSFLFDLMEVD